MAGFVFNGGRKSEIMIPCTRPHVFSALIATIAVLYCAGCTTYGVKVDSRTERTQKRHVEQVLTTAPSSDASQALGQAEKAPEDEQLPILLKAARLAENSGETAVYNAALGRVVTWLAEKTFADVPGVLAIARKGTSVVDPATASTLTLASAVTIKGLHERATQGGVGVPYVAWFKKGSPALEGQPGIPPAGLALPVTAVLTFRGERAKLEFYNTLNRDHVTAGGKRRHLAADYTAPIAILLSHGKNRSIDVRAMFQTRQNVSEAGLFQLEPYDPNKIPVIFVHGLMSRPEAWVQAMNTLFANPTIRKKYQFWFLLYPTGLPVWGSAWLLRKEMDRFHQELDPSNSNPNMRRMILVGHSMGGLISSLVVREGGDKLWSQFSDVPAHSLNLSPKAKKQLLETMYFSPRNDVSRVIFVATPHLGSNLALRPIAGFFASFIQLPRILLPGDRLIVLRSLRANLRNAFSTPVNSVKFLRAKSPLLQAILKLPMKKGMPYHSIIGDRGRGNTPNSSDGIVPYWSSHMEGAVSEKIVPSGHGANENAEGIAEIKRILLEAAKD